YGPAAGRAAGQLLAARGADEVAVLTLQDGRQHVVEADGALEEAGQRRGRVGCRRRGVARELRPGLVRRRIRRATGRVPRVRLDLGRRSIHCGRSTLPLARFHLHGVSRRPHQQTLVKQKSDLGVLRAK
ncbi:unnamed protein product, partial [Ixodes persulcatus]